MNYITSKDKLQALIFKDGGVVDCQNLDYLALSAVATLGEAVCELSDCPIDVLTRLHGLLSDFDEQGRVQDIMQALYIINGMLGSETAEYIGLINDHEEARNRYIYGFIANLGEYIEEIKGFE